MLKPSLRILVPLFGLALLSAAADLAAQSARPKMPAEVIYPSSVGDVRFPHRAHVKMKCPTCHHQIHAAALVTPHDEYLDSAWVNCNSCHSEESEFSGKYYKCSNCHYPTPQNISDETLSSKVVTHESCWKCHETGTGVEASQSCDECHVRNEEP